METRLQADGSNLLIGTNLHNYAMPMIRYEQNDLGRIEERPCDCGWSFRVLIDLQGRKNDSFILSSGKTISSGFLLDATYEILLTHRTAVKDFCHIQMTRSEIILEVVTGEGWSADVRRAIEGRFATFFEPGVRFFIALVEVCPKTKSGNQEAKAPRRAFLQGSHRTVLQGQSRIPPSFPVWSRAPGLHRPYWRPRARLKYGSLALLRCLKIPFSPNASLRRQLFNEHGMSMLGGGSRWRWPFFAAGGFDKTCVKRPSLPKAYYMNSRLPPRPDSRRRSLRR